METISLLLTTPGIGGIIATVVLVGATALYVGLVRWILQGAKKDQPSHERMGWPFE